MNVSEALVKELALCVVNAESFTCYDMTKKLREYVEDVPHRDVRTLLHSWYDANVMCNEGMFWDMDFVRTTAEFADGTFVEVFHNEGNDAQAYIDSIDNTVAKSSSSPACGDCTNKIYDLEYELAHAINSLIRAEDILDRSLNSFYFGA